jgi:hypothetical protein
MAIHLVAGSVAMLVTQKPKVTTPSVNAASTDMTFTCSQDLIANGLCRITGAAGDSPAGWTLGLIQMEWIETNWGFYRGQFDKDGSSFLQRARPPARPKQGCRDTLVAGAIFVDNNPGGDRTVATAGTALPATLTAAFNDGPTETYPLTRVNSLTGKTNFLREVQLEFHFCTVLTLKDPGTNFTHLKHLLWNVHWQAEFLPTNFANIAAAWTITKTGGALGNTANVSAVANGGPSEARFTSIITTAGAPNCNAVATAAAAGPNIRENAKWANFDVTR